MFSRTKVRTFGGGWRYVSLLLYVCGRALDDLTKILPLYVPTRRRFVYKFQQCGGTLSFSSSCLGCRE